MLTLGIVLMIAGFLGVLICAKLAKSNPAIQPIALLCALVMLGGLGTYAYNYMNDSGVDMESGIIYQCSIMDQAGDYLKNAAPGKKVVLIIEPGLTKYENGKKLIDAKIAAFEKAYGSKPEIVELTVEGMNEDEGMMVSDSMKPEDFEKIVEANPDADIFISDLGLPMGGVPDFKEKIVFLTSSGMIENRELRHAIEDGKITALVSGKDGKIDPDFEPDADDLKQAFLSRWIIVDKNNVNKLK